MSSVIIGTHAARYSRQRGPVYPASFLVSQVVARKVINSCDVLFLCKK